MELCAICKETRQNCTQECVLLAPYLPANEADKYACLVKVFAIENVVRMLSEIDPTQRQACMDSLCFEAEARIRDPVYGASGIVSRLQRRIQHLELSLKIAQWEKAMIKHGQNHLPLPIKSPL